MPIALKTTTTTTIADRLIALYRREAEHWSPRELLEQLLECSGNMPAGTVATCARKLERPGCGPAAVSKIAADVIRELVALGLARDVETFLDRQATARADAEREPVIARLRAGLDRLARRPDALADLEAVEQLVNRLTAGAA